MTSPDEVVWALGAQCGDRNALEQLLRRVQPSIRRYVTRLVGAPDADDVTQDVLVAIARNVVWLLEPGLFRAWAFRIASRAAFSHLRRVRRRGVEDNADVVLASLPAPASLVQMIMIAGGTAAVILHVSRMTRVILRALETAAKR